MIEEIYTYFTIEMIYLWLNIGVVPFWLLLIFFPQTKLCKILNCINCGIYTHHNPRSSPSMTGFNLGCVDEINTFDLKNITINDGHNHPLDKK